MKLLTTGLDSGVVEYSHADNIATRALQTIFVAAGEAYVRTGGMTATAAAQYRTEPWCQNADAGLKQLTTGRNADAFFQHSGSVDHWLRTEDQAHQEIIPVGRPIRV